MFVFVSHGVALLVEIGEKTAITWVSKDKAKSLKDADDGKPTLPFNLCYSWIKI